MNRYRSHTSYNKEKEKGQVVQGMVTEALPNALFRVSLNSGNHDGGGGGNGGEISKGEEILAYLAGNMRLHRIRVLIGDKVMVLLDPYGGKGRITKRM